MQAAAQAHIIHILLSSQACGPVSRVECVLSSRIVGFSISGAIEASLRCIQETSRAVPRGGGWTSFFFGKSQARTAPLSQYKGLSFLFRELSRIFIRWTEIL